MIQSVESARAEVDAGLELGTSPAASSPSSAISLKDANAAHSSASAATVSVAESPSGGARTHDSLLSGDATDESVPELVAESEGSDEDEDEDDDEDFEVEMEADADNHEHHQFHELALKPEAELIYSTCKTLYVMLRADPGALTLARWKLGLFLHTSSAAASVNARSASAGHASASSETKQMRGLDCMLQLIRRGHSTPETQFGPHCTFDRELDLVCFRH